MSWKDKFPKEDRYFETDDGILYNCDSVKLLKKIPDNSIDLVVTSPPYDNLRLYDGIDWGEHVWKPIIQELYRITKKGGVVVWVIGDATIKGSETGTSFKQALYAKEVGFKLHDTMIYMKSSFSKPSSNRYHQIFEYMFIFSKGKPKTFNPIKDRKNKYAGQTCWGKNTVRQKDGKLRERPKKVNSEYGMRFNVWRYAVGGGIGQKDRIAYKHPATFPEQLAYDHIISWSDKKDIVLDPFIGSGTVAKQCEILDRKWVGVEINRDYCNIARERIEKWQRGI